MQESGLSQSLTAMLLLPQTRYYQRCNCDCTETRIEWQILAGDTHNCSTNNSLKFGLKNNIAPSDILLLPLGPGAVATNLVCNEPSVKEQFDLLLGPLYLR